MVLDEAIRVVVVGGGCSVLMFGHSVPPGMLDQAVTAGPNALVLVQNLGQINVYSLGNCVDTPPHHPPTPSATLPIFSLWVARFKV